MNFNKLIKEILRKSLNFLYASSNHNSLYFFKSIFFIMDYKALLVALKEKRKNMLRIKTGDY